MSNISSEENVADAQATLTKPTTPTTMNPEQVAQNIKNIARKIREESARMRDTVRVIHESGAVEELSDAIKEAAIAARDTSREISETARVLKERGVIRDTASVVDETARNAIETAETVKVISKEARNAAPETAAAIATASGTAQELVRDGAEKTNEAAAKESIEKAKGKSKKSKK